MKILKIINVSKMKIVFLLALAGSSLLAMQTEDLSQNISPDTVHVRSHDGVFTWLLEREALQEADVLKIYLEDSERISKKREGTILDLDSNVGNADFELFQKYLNKAWQVSQLPQAFSEYSAQILYRIAATAHYFQAPKILHAAAFEIAQRIQQPEHRKYILNHGTSGIALNDDVKKIIARKILSPRHAWFWLHADKERGKADNKTKPYTISYNRNLEVYNPESIKIDSDRSRIITVFAKCAASQGHQVSYDKKIELWDLNTRKSLKKLVLPRTGLVAIDAVGNRIAVQKDDLGVKEKLITVWHLETEKCIHEIPILHSDIKEITFSPKQNLLAACFSNQQIQIWDLADKSGKIVAKQISEGKKLQFDLEAKLVAIQVGDDIQIWDIQNNKLFKTLASHGSSITSCIFNPCKPIISVGSSDGTMRLWNFNRDTLLIRAGCHVQFNSQGNRIATEYGVYDVDEGVPLILFPKPFRKFAFNGQGTFCVGYYLEGCSESVRYHICDLNKNIIDIEADKSDSIFCGPNSMELNREGNLLLTQNYKRCNVYNLFDLEVYKFLKQDKTIEEALVLAHHREIDAKSPIIKSLLSGMPKSLQKSINAQLKKQ